MFGGGPAVARSEASPGPAVTPVLAHPAFGM
jgi:hypothetical protein